MILQKIQRLIRITEDNILVQTQNYGISGVIDNFLTKAFSYNITSNFDDLIEAIESAASLLNINIIDIKDNEELLNRAIYKCKQDDGKCIINIFFDAINQILTLLLDKYLNLLSEFNIDLSRISTFEELVRLDLRRYHNLSTIDRVMFDVYKNYINSIHQDNFNDLFFKMNSSIINASFIKNKLNFIDNYIVTIINNKLGKRMSISQR